jgi:hypothetical protein
MPNEAIVLEHPAARTRPEAPARGTRLRGWPIFALGLVAAGSVLAVLALLVAVLAAPLVFGLVAWLAWRSRGPRRHARSLVRLRTRLRARSLGLEVLPGAPRPAAVRAVR